MALIRPLSGYSNRKVLGLLFHNKGRKISPRESLNVVCYRYCESCPCDDQDFTGKYLDGLSILALFTSQLDFFFLGLVWEMRISRSGGAGIKDYDNFF